MWLYCTGIDSPDNKFNDVIILKIMLYDYNISRDGKCALDYLKGYSGYLQVDSYVGYEQS